MQNLQKTLALTLLFLLASCLQETDLAYPSHPLQPVLNGILHPDSTLQVHLSWSNPLGQDSIYQAIDNATIRIFENDQLLGEMTYQDSGKYQLSQKPILLNTYRIEVEVPGQPLITAEDKVPKKPEIISVIGQETDFYSYAMHKIDIQDIPNTPNRYWLYGQKKEYKRLEIDYDSEIPPQDQPTYDPNIIEVETRYSYNVIAPPPFLDRFNATFQEYDNAYYFSGYIRFTDTGVDGKDIAFDLETSINQFTKYWRCHCLTNDVESIGFYIHLINASTHYDQYLKSTFIQFINEGGDIPNPFAEPTKIYSNVNNGLGIFAAYNSHIKKTHYKEGILERNADGS